MVYEARLDARCWMFEAWCPRPSRCDRETLERNFDHQDVRALDANRLRANGQRWSGAAGDQRRHLVSVSIARTMRSLPSDPTIVLDADQEPSGLGAHAIREADCRVDQVPVATHA
jgi:hypothetical protein